MGILPGSLPDLGGHLVIISPHDDDAALGAGGLMLQRSAERKRTTVLVLTDGSLGYTAPDQKRSIVAARKKEAKGCYALLGAGVLFLGLPDMCLHQYRCWRTLTGREGGYLLAVRALRKLGATSLLIPNPADRHPDHKAAHDIARTAAFQAKEAIAPDIGAPAPLGAVLCYAVWNPLPEESHAYRMTAGQLAAKRDALARFASQKPVISGLLKGLSEREPFWMQET